MTKQYSRSIQASLFLFGNALEARQHNATNQKAQSECGRKAAPKLNEEVQVWAGRNSFFNCFFLEEHSFPCMMRRSSFSMASHHKLRQEPCACSPVSPMVMNADLQHWTGVLRGLNMQAYMQHVLTHMSSGHAAPAIYIFHTVAAGPPQSNMYIDNFG